MTAIRANAGLTVARNSAILMVGQVLTQAISLGLGIFIARSLGNVDYGRYVAAFAFATVFTSFTSLGLDKLITREMARRPAEAAALMRDAGLSRFAISVIVFGIMIGATYVLRLDSQERLLALLAGLVTVSTSLTDFLRSVFQAFERMEYDTLTRLTERVIAAGLTVLVFFAWPTVGALVVGLLAANLTALVITSRLTGQFIKFQGTFDYQRSLVLLRMAVPFGITATAVGIITRLDTFLLSLLRSEAEVGWYGVAINVILPFTMIPLAFSTSLFPHLSKRSREHFASAKEISQLSLKWILIIGLPIGAGLAALADKIVVPIFGREFAGAVAPLRILSVGLVLIFSNTVLSNVLGAIDRQRWVAGIVVLELGLTVALGLILIPRFGVLGAAVATVGRDAFGFIAMSGGLGREVGAASLFGQLLRLGVAALVLFGAMWVTRDAGLAGMLLAGFSAYAIMLAGTRLVDRSDWLLASQMLKAWRTSGS